MKKIIILMLVSLFAAGLYSQEITVPVNGGSIYGILSIPEKIQTFPLVIIVAGSGATDKDGNSGAQLHTDAYKNLAEELNHYGLAVFRYDKRLIGKSIFPNLKEEDLRFETYTEDLVRIIQFMKKMNGVSSVFLIGHSEGSLLSIIAAQKEKIAGLISVAGAGKNAADLIQEQVDKNVNNPEFIKKEVADILKELRSGKKAENVQSYLTSLFRKSVQPYLIDWFKFSPIVEIQKLSIPCLIINGGDDVQVSVDNANLLHKNCKNGRLVIIPNMTHTLKETSSSISQLQTYIEPSLPVSKKLIESISEFVLELK